MTHLPNPTDPSPSFWRSKAGVALIMLLVIGVFYLLREHYSHASQMLPYLILLLCPLMDLFGDKHGGHASHRNATDDPADDTRK